MIDDPNIYRAAKLLLDRYGEDAPSRAARRAYELAQGGDAYGSATWRQIAGAIEDMTRGRAPGEAVN